MSCSTHVFPPQSETARTLKKAIEKHDRPICLMLCLRQIISLHFGTLDIGVGGLIYFGIYFGATEHQIKALLS